MGMIITREETHRVILNKKYDLSDEQLKAIFPEYTKEMIKGAFSQDGIAEDPAIIELIDEAISDGEIEPIEEEEEWYSAIHGDFPIEYSI